MYFCFSIRDMVRDELPDATPDGVDACGSMCDMCAIVKYLPIPFNYIYLLSFPFINHNCSNTTHTQKTQQQLDQQQLLQRLWRVCAHNVHTASQSAVVAYFYCNCDVYTLVK